MHASDEPNSIQMVRDLGIYGSEIHVLKSTLTNSFLDSTSCASRFVTVLFDSFLKFSKFDFSVSVSVLD